MSKEKLVINNHLLTQKVALVEKSEDSYNIFRPGFQFFEDSF